MKSAVAICLTILLLSVVTTNAQFVYGYGYPGWGHPRWGGPRWGPRWGAGRGLAYLGTLGLLTSGNRFGQAVGGLSLLGLLGGGFR